jgi:hypothetical protein
MPDVKTPRQHISEALLLERLARADEFREFFVQMWLQNPALAAQGGVAVQEIIAPLESQAWPDGSR